MRGYLKIGLRVIELFSVEVINVSSNVTAKKHQSLHVAFMYAFFKP